MQTQSEQINELMGALAKAQGEMTGAIKDSNNPFFKSKYADLNSVWQACREPLSKNGLAIVQTVQQRESGDVLYTVLGHSSGQWISSTMAIRLKNDNKSANEIQQLGSCLTYLRRYSLAALVGVAPDEDDDGNAAQGYQAKPANSPAPKTQAQKTIAPERASELREVIKKCSPGFIQFVGDYLKKSGISDLNALPEVLFDNLNKQAIDDFARFQASKKYEEVGEQNGAD